MEQLGLDIITTSPLVAATTLVLLAVLAGSFVREAENLLYWLSMFGLAVVIWLSFWTFPMKGTAFNGMIHTGGYASFVYIMFALSAALTLALSREYLPKIGAHFGEYYMLVTSTLLGMMAFAAGNDLIVTFLGLEIMSVGLYVLAGFTRKVQRANEASLKYFLLGAFATGFFLYGIALLYGASGTTNLSSIAAAMGAHSADPLFWTGAGLLLIGFAFKVGAVPFHMWVPDVYEGSPTPVSAFMATGPKAAAFAAIVLIFTATMDTVGTQLATAVAVLATASMIVGNVIALSQNHIKRMLAYSSIAHAGYMLIGVAAGSMLSVQAVLFYLASYMFTNLGAFGVVSLIEDEQQTPVTMDDMKGLGARKPLLGALMAVFMFSLIGIPPLSGFFGKYYVFAAAIEQGYTWLAIVGVLTSMISIYYYLRVVVLMYFRDAETERAVLLTPSGIVTLLVSAVGVFALGIGPQAVIRWLEMLF